MEIKQVRFEDTIVTPEGYLFTPVESKTSDKNIRPILGGFLAGLYEEGVNVPSGSVISRDIVTRIGPFEVRRVHLGKRPAFNQRF